MCKSSACYLKMLCCITMKSTVLFIAFASTLASMPGLFRTDILFYITVGLLSFHVLLAFLFVRYTFLNYSAFPLTFLIDLFVQLGFNIYLVVCYVICDVNKDNDGNNKTRNLIAFITSCISIAILIICIFLLYNVFMVVFNEDDDVNYNYNNRNVTQEQVALEHMMTQTNVSHYEVEPVTYVDVHYK